ncbi:hypothetical protein [Pyrobaculum ferrireducens]|uniref:Uncharacterized protein n=1 Tax=Pyrobaculum ferrireducens TaxID=1104324 RepID=G7VFU8_9CREN|nr:hypothetical protein [Pyrobaculum ferrireducens]AET31755.1 hypothetical protein P186_0297 [Pyrobaculum ferrireducens]
MVVSSLKHGLEILSWIDLLRRRARKAAIDRSRLESSWREPPRRCKRPRRGA